MHLRDQFFYLIAALSIGAIGGCSSTASGDPGSSGGPGGLGGTASGGEIGSCKKSCDKMKFFDCSSADEQARCYQDCDKASSSQIDIFTGCAQNSICDPQCRTTIQPKESEGSGGGGASASTCATACDKLVSCSKIPLGAKAECNAQCASKGYQYQIDCVNKTACESLEATCGGASESGGSGESSSGASASGGSSSGGTTDTTAQCLSECDSINFFKCAPVALHAACRSECSAATASTRDAFTTCSKSSGVDCERKSECLDAFLK